MEMGLGVRCPAGGAKFVFESLSRRGTRQGRTGAASDSAAV